MTNYLFSFFNFMLFWALLPISQFSFAQNIQWQKCLGGTDDDLANSIQQTTDGGYILAGETQSDDGDVSGFHLNSDVWVVKLTASGALQWQTCLGGSSTEEAYAIQQTSDGGYILTAYTESNDGDVSGNHGVWSSDFWVVKLSSTGVIQWQKCLGGTSLEEAYAIQQTSDGGYILTGYATSINGDVSGIHGGYLDAWVVKLLANGDIQWQKCLGGTDDEKAYAIQQTSDGGYILTGYTESNDGDVSGNHDITGLFGDVWVVKLSTTGTIEWQKCLGGTDHEQAYAIRQTADGGYILTGKTSSNDGDVSGNHGGSGRDAWVVKLSSTGAMQWQKAIGGIGDEFGRSIQNTSDGGYVLTGNTTTSIDDGDVSGHHGGYNDVWLVKLNATGTIQGQKCLGGTNSDIAYSIQQTMDDGYILAGTTGSNDGNVSGQHNPTSVDVWVVKLDNSWVGVADEISLTNLSVSPNPVSGNKLTLNYHLNKTTALEINISDVLGNTVLSEKEVVEAVGKHQKEVNLDAIPSGIYFLQVTTEYGSYTTKIIKN